MLLTHSLQGKLLHKTLHRMLTSFQQCFTVKTPNLMSHIKSCLLVA